MKKGYKPARQKAELGDRRAETFYRHIRGENFSTLAKDYGLSVVTISHDIKLVREELQREMRDELLGLIAESYSVYQGNKNLGIYKNV